MHCQQVKNYFMRQKEDKPEWESIAVEADLKHSRGEKRPAPPPISVPSVMSFNKSLMQLESDGRKKMDKFASNDDIDGDCGLSAYSAFSLQSPTPYSPISPIEISFSDPTISVFCPIKGCPRS